MITDGIGMASLFSLLPYEELIVGLVNAGNDVILGAKLPSGDIIERAVLDGRIPESRIDDACRRILDLLREAEEENPKDKKKKKS